MHVGVADYIVLHYWREVYLEIVYHFPNNQIKVLAKFSPTRHVLSERLSILPSVTPPPHMGQALYGPNVPQYNIRMQTRISSEVGVWLQS